MAADDPYDPAFASISDQATATFDGSASSTNKAIVNEIAGNGDAEIRLQESNDSGSTWTTIAQLETDGGSTTFTGDFHTQYNRILVEADGSEQRRIEIKNISGSTAEYSVSGDER
jgi:hypothetical protein